VCFEAFLSYLFALGDDWISAARPLEAKRRPGRPLLLSGGEVPTLAILSQ
jgi:hypothetical protein